MKHKSHIKCILVQNVYSLLCRFWNKISIHPSSMLFIYSFTEPYGGSGLENGCVFILFFIKPYFPTRTVKPKISYTDRSYTSDTLWGSANSSHEENRLICILNNVLIKISKCKEVSMRVHFSGRIMV